MLKHYDDGKGKWQSHEVWAENNNNNDDDFLMHIYRGYGSNFEEALSDYKKKVEKAKEELNSIDYENVVEVNYNGIPRKRDKDV